VPVAPVASGETGNGVAFLVSAGIVYEIIAAACSSPQTAEINADKRASTLMKWVHIGLAQSVAFVTVAVILEPKHAAPIVAGGLFAGGIMYGSYLYAMHSGLSSNEPGTEGQGDGGPWSLPKAKAA
jgi:hypothetical protein